MNWYKVSIQLCCIFTNFSPTGIFSPSHFYSMSRRSPRKKAITPEFVATSDDEDFVAIASDHPYVASYFVLCPLLTFIYLSPTASMGRILMTFNSPMTTPAILSKTATMAKRTPNLLALL
jgi:hypothetical protein